MPDIAPPDTYGPLRRLPVLLVSLLATCIVLPGCGSADSNATGSTAGSAPTPGERQETAILSTAPDASVIRETYVRQYEPLPEGSAEHPPECDWISYLRFRHKDGPADPSAADAVLTAMPGNLAGAGHFDILARNVIHDAAEQGKHVEFWALERRSNCLEDRRGILAATQAHDYRVALDYYYNGKAIDGQTFKGFYSSEDLPFLADFGVAQTVRDWHAVLTRGIPDPAVRAKKVFCGGHSQGGLITADFAGWDFDGDPDTDADAGYKQCAGFFALETLVTLDPLSASALSPVLNIPVGTGYEGVVQLLRAGALPRNETSGAPLTPETMMVLTLSALAGYQVPDEESEIPAKLPHNQNIDTTLKLLFSRDAIAFATGQPDVRDVRMTNEALFGALIDDNSMPLGFVAASVGTFDGGPVVEKTFPTPDLVNALTAGLPTQVLLTSNRRMIPAQTKGPLYSWRNYDKVDEPYADPQVDTLGQPFTSAASENTDIRQWARASFEGPADLVEWYMPTRLIVDNVFALLGTRSGDLASLRYNDGPQQRPILTILGSESLGSAGATPDLDTPPNRLLVLPGYNHPDVTSASRTQNDGSREQSSQALTDFVLAIAGS